MRPETGDVLWIGPAAGVQFRARPILFRVIRRLPWQTSWEGTIWLDGYELNEDGEAAVRRSVYVIEVGLQYREIVPRRTRRSASTGERTGHEVRPVG